MIRFNRYSFLLLLLITAGCSNYSDSDNSDKERGPNIVYIFADDLGYGDLGCFGASDIKTPNIDRIASNGIKFTDFYSASSICSPSRAGLMTGRLPARMGIHQAFFPSSFTGMANEEITIAEKLKEKNYATAIIGKWHLGHMPEFLPLQQGFDYYYGIPYSNDMRSALYMKNNSVDSFHIDQSQMVKTYVRESLQFIDRHKNESFFLYLAHNMPHVPIYASPDFIGSSERGIYGDVVQEIDWSVGEIIKKLEQLDILENTMVVFSSDNGPWLVMEELGGSAGELREGKFYTFEGGFRVPTVAMWPGTIKPNQVNREVATQMDWFPTFCELANVPLPENVVIDGQSLVDVLLNEGSRNSQEVLYFNLIGELTAYRSGDYKIKMPFKGFKSTHWNKGVPAHDSLVFNLSQDPGENNNIIDTYENSNQLFVQRNSALKRLGELPDPIVIRTMEDNAHYNFLNQKYSGEKYWEKWD